MNSTKLKREVLKILNNSKFYAFDIGASVELPSHWAKLKEGLTFIAVEPDKNSAENLLNKYSDLDYKVSMVGLSKSGGVKTLFCTATSTGSSLLEIDPQNPYMSNTYVYPITKINIDTITFDNLVDNTNAEEVNLVKLDTQGSELDILKGLSDNYFENCIGIELELGIPGGYINQPTMNEFNDFLYAKNFELFDIRPGKAYHQGMKKDHKFYLKQYLNVYDNSPTVTRKIFESDFLYLKSPETILKKNSELLIRKAIIAYCIYNFYIEAFYLLEIALQNKTISVETYNTLLNSIIKIHQEKEYNPIYSKSAFWTLIRKILSKFRIKFRSTLYWSGYMSQGD